MKNNTYQGHLGQYRRSEEVMTYKWWEGISCDHIILCVQRAGRQVYEQKAHRERN